MHLPIVEQCRESRCQNIVQFSGDECCACYMDPSIWWKPGHPYFEVCPMVPQKVIDAGGFMLNPLKKSKRKGGNRPMVPTRKYQRSGRGRRKRYVESTH